MVTIDAQREWILQQLTSRFADVKTHYAWFPIPGNLVLPVDIPDNIH